MTKAIVGGVVTLIIGGTGFTVSQTDVVSNFANETGMTQQQAQQYVDGAQQGLKSFSEIGQDLIKDGNSVSTTASGMDCVNYTYEWETADLSCAEGKTELNTVGASETQLGNCYVALGTDLGSTAKSKMTECITDIDDLNAGFDLPITAKLIDASAMTDTKNTNAYNKSTLQAALKA